MGNIFVKINEYFKRNNKQILISSSGSVPGAKLERIRSGQAYLYQKNGMESEVMEITFHKKVSGSFLNQALLETIKRYLYLNTKLVELLGFSRRQSHLVLNDVKITVKLHELRVEIEITLDRFK